MKKSFCSGWRAPFVVIGCVAALSSCAGDATNPDSAANNRSGNPPAFIEVTPTQNTIPVAGGSVTLTVTVRDSRGKKIGNPRVTWTSLESSVADVDAGGKVRSYKKGTANVIATAATVSDTAQIMVQADAPATASVIIVPDNDTIPTIGNNTVLTAIVLDAAGNDVPGATVVWSSLNPSIASVNSSGLVSGLASGMARITATHNTTADTAIVWVAPAPPPTSLVVTPAVDSVTVVNATKQFTATVKDAGGVTQNVPVVWQSLDTGVATVDGTGKATAKTKGTARIVATYQSLADTSLFKVNLPAQATRIEITPQADTIPSVGGDVTLAAVVYDESSNPMSASVTWSSLDPSIAVVTGPGKVAGILKGIARIMAKTGSLADTATVWVAPAPSGPGSTFYLHPNPMLLDQVGSMWLVLGKLDSAGVVRQVVTSFTATNPSIVSVDGNGWVTANATGTAQVIGTYNGKKDTTDIKVGGHTTASFLITVDLDTLDVVGDTVRLHAEAYDPSNFQILNPAVTWSSLSSSIATVSGAAAIGKVTAIAPGTTKIIARRGTFADTTTIVVRGSGGGGGGTGTMTVTINRQVDTIPSLPGTRQLSASVKDAQGNLVANQSVTWSSLDPQYATVNSSSGLVTGVAKGTARIRAVQGTLSDTMSMVVAPNPPAPPQNGLTVDLKVVRYDGSTGIVQVSGGIPLPPNYLHDTQLRNLIVNVGGVEQALYVEALKGRHADGSLRSVLVQWRMSVGSSGAIAQLVLGPNVNRTTTDIAKISTTATYSKPLPTAYVAPSNPSYIMSTGLLGEMTNTSFYSTWVNNFTTYGDPKWNTMVQEYGTSALDGNKITTYNYYDRALSNYAWWARTGNTEYFKRATYYLIPYRDWGKSIGWNTQPNNVQIEGIEIHYLLTGDQESWDAVAGFGWRTLETFLSAMGQTTIYWNDNRIQARTLDIALTAYRLGVTNRNYASEARQALTAILGSQSADGAYRLAGHCYQDTPFMNGLLNDVLIKYYTYFEQDSRIPAAIKKNLDFMWSKQWRAANAAFVYVEAYCDVAGGPDPAPDLNLMIATGYSWYARYSGDGTYRGKGDQVFMSGTTNSWLEGQKQFNENYHSSFRYDAYRQ